MNSHLPLPSLWRCFLCISYEVLLLIGVFGLGFMIPHLILGLWFHITASGYIVLIHLFLLFGSYFIGYWMYGGQTLAMQTWKIRLVGKNGQPLILKQAIMRYIFASMWFIFAIFIVFLIKPTGLIHLLLLFFITLFLPFICAVFDKDKLFLHDRLTCTKLILVTQPH